MIVYEKVLTANVFVFEKDGNTSFLGNFTFPGKMGDREIKQQIKEENGLAVANADILIRDKKKSEVEYEVDPQYLTVID